MRTPLASVLISMSFPGIARHILSLLFAWAGDLTDRHTVTEHYSITLDRIRQEPERYFLDYSLDANLAENETFFCENLADLSVKQVH
ncbi:MAG: hypothetical protein ACR2G0_04240 [Chthoniobacterales bacterium]